MYRHVAQECNPQPLTRKSIRTTLNRLIPNEYTAWPSPEWGSSAFSLDTSTEGVQVDLHELRPGIWEVMQTSLSYGVIVINDAELVGVLCAWDVLFSRNATCTIAAAMAFCAVYGLTVNHIGDTILGFTYGDDHQEIHLDTTGEPIFRIPGGDPQGYDLAQLSAVLPCDMDPLPPVEMCDFGDFTLSSIEINAGTPLTNAFERAHGQLSL